MSEHEFKVSEKKVKLTVLGKEYPCRFPTKKERAEFERQTKEAKGDADSEKVADTFLVKMGIPQEALESLDTEDYLEFLKWLLIGGKKN